jgi:hypothetical protein
MRLRRHRSGGILWDAFLILGVCAGAFMAWRSRDRWLNVFQGKTAAPVASPAVRLNRQSANAQSRVRAFLAASGVGEKHILKSFNQERREGNVSWLESTLEITRPKGFQVGPFLKSVLSFLSQNELALMRDDTDPGTWTLEFGDRSHVFQRLVIHDRS